MAAFSDISFLHRSQVVISLLPSLLRVSSDHFLGLARHYKSYVYPYGWVVAVFIRATREKVLSLPLVTLVADNIYLV